MTAVAGSIWVWRERRFPDTQPLAAGALLGANLLLVTIDTLRADHVGAYGGTQGATPTLDGLAHEGLRFDVVYAHVPLTLPSHTTIMTGTNPYINGVRDNGSFRFDGKRPTLASVLKAAGYRTAAFVGSFVLDARFGLNAGFDLYDDRMRGSGSNPEVVQRTAEQVLEPAADWILGTASGSATAGGAGAGIGHGAAVPAGRTGSSPSGPFFAWVHLYDPHEPYMPPEPYRSRFASDPYAGEIAYADAMLGAFLERLRSGGELDHTLVVIAADHGESLGEHGERTHGLFAYNATLRVPLLLWAPPVIRPGVVASPARLIDIMPTILDLVGADVPRSLDGRSARPFVGGREPFDDDGSYFEALNANLTRNWAPLKGIVRGSLKLIDLPIPELYDLSSDPAETRNIYATRRDRARDLEARLDRLNGGAHTTPSAAPVDAEAEARLRSLGYVVGSTAKRPPSYRAADDPKTLVHLDAALDDAAAMWSRGEGERAIETVQAVINERPDLTLAYDRLAFMVRSAGRIGQAVNVLDQAARAGHADRALLRSLGSMLRDAGDLPRSASLLETIVHQDASDLQAMDALGQTYTRMGRAQDAEVMFRRVLAGSPNGAVTWNNLGTAYLVDGRSREALDAFATAVSLNPELASAHNGLGVAYAKRGQTERAIAEWRRAVELRPGYPDALSNLQRAGRQ
jgi:arylsulfatase A-like enzyme/Flp pilus assembly protein TadD